MKKAAYLMSAFAALAFGTAVANAQTPDAAAATSASALQLSAVDDNFIAQANLGAPFQIASSMLLDKAGFRLERVVPTQSAVSSVEARPV